jgi:hypothetical protein
MLFIDKKLQVDVRFCQATVMEQTPEEMGTSTVRIISEADGNFAKTVAPRRK